jgi:hypothetical protein
MSRGLSAHDDFVSDVSNRNGRPLVAHKDGRDRSSCWPGDLCPAVRQRLMERAEGPDQATVRTWRGSAMPFSWCVPHSANSKRGDRQHKARFRPFGPQRGDRITSEGVGSSDPAVPNDSEEHRAKNRRIVVVIQPVK